MNRAENSKMNRRSDTPHSAHPWSRATQDDLTKVWFASHLEKIVEAIRDFGAQKEVAVGLELVKADRFANRYSDVLAVLKVDDLLVPFHFDAGNRGQPQMTPSGFGDLLIAEIERIATSKQRLSDRYAEMRQSALRSAEAIGPHSTLDAIVLQPVVLGRDDPTNLQQPVLVSLTCLNGHLEASQATFSAQSASEIEEYYAHFIPGQRIALEQMYLRQQRPFDIEIDQFAKAILDHAGVSADQVIATEPGVAIGIDSLEYGRSRLSNVSFFLSQGRISTRFFFVGGEYNDGRLLVYQDLPEIVKQGLLGRTTDAIVSGGIFDNVSAKILSYEDLNQMVRFTLSQQFVTTRLMKPWQPGGDRDSQ